MKERRNQDLFVPAIAAELGIGLAALLAGWTIRMNPFAGITFSAESLIWGCAAALPPLVLLYLLQKTSIPAVHRLMHTSRRLIQQFFGTFSLLQIILLSAAAGIGEELLFRGIIQAGLTGQIGLFWSVATTSLIFGLLHFITRGYAVYAFCMSVYLGIVYAASGNILIPVLAHAVYDAAVLWKLSRPKA
ncbi:MAG: CPBP family intramembrane glutamic endopeptidase [Spirochaeta sp.]